MRFNKISTAVVLLCGIQSIGAIYEKNKGANEWRIENIGDIQDVKFLDESPQMYVISKDGLLSFFDVEMQSFIWKKQMTLPQSNIGDELSDSKESFNLH